MIENVCNKVSTLPLTTIGYFDSNDELNIIIDKITSHHDLTVCYIRHKGEDGDKDHYHIFFKSNNSTPIDVTKLAIFFEKDYNGKRAYSILNGEFRQCKSPITWFLYSKHDVNYLLSIGESRLYHYHNEDFVCNNDIFFNNLVDYKFDYEKSMSDIDRILYYLSIGKSDFEIVRLFNVPLTKIGFVLSTIKEIKKTL